MNYDYLMNTEVLNNMNETNLEYIGIFGLFGRYNIDIPFNKQVNIFIGENGLGKTTILNCIYFVLEKKFSRLSNVQFSEIKVKFKKDDKTYKITAADIREYNKSKDGISFPYLVENDMYINEIIERMIRRYKDINLDFGDEPALDRIAIELARKMDMPFSYARNYVLRYLENKNIIYKSKKKGDRNNVVELDRAISKYVTRRIIYLPTYRRIEDDFTSLNLRSEELNKAELLIRFGMSDVQNSIERILEKIRSLAMKGFTEMTGILLKQYTDGKDPIDEMKKSKRSFFDIDIDTVKIVLDRVGKEIERPYKEKILKLISSDEIINNYKYFYLLDLLNKLIDNYDVQRSYDDRIKKFADTCNKYLIDKHFDYNQSTLDLEVYLDAKIAKDKDKRVIKLTQLSSGEKQIVSLFSKLYLESDDSSIVIIDEPELSLSIGWQQMLLPDIMRSKNCDLLLTVTHSPFIFQNEFDEDAKEIRQFIKTNK